MPRSGPLGRMRRNDGERYRPVFHALVTSPISAFSGSRIADGVREKRGAGRRLRHAVALDEDLSRGHVRMLRRFRHGQDRREADVGAFHDLAPVLARLALEHLCQLLLQRRPGLAVHLRVEIGVGEAGVLAQQRVELRLDRADRDEIAAGAFIDAVEMRAAVEEVLVAAFGPAADRGHVEEHRHQRRRAVAHRGVHHLALAGLRGFQQCGEHADHEIERAAAEIADQIERRHRLLLGADRGERAGDRDVVDVMAGGVRQRAFLAPAGHAAVDQLWIAREHDVGAEAEPLHHAGAKTFDQRIGAGEQVEHLRDRGLVLQIELDHLAAAAGDRLQVLARRRRDRASPPRRPCPPASCRRTGPGRCRRIRRCGNRRAGRRCGWRSGRLVCRARCFLSQGGRFN